MNLTPEKFKEHQAQMDLPDGRIGHIELLFCTSYSIKEVSELPPEGLEIFSKTNSVYNLYPFLRSNVAEACLKLGIPSVTLPMMKPPTFHQIDSMFQKKLEV